MGVRVQNDQSPSLGVLLRELAEGSASLIRQEVRLARLELSDLFGAIATGSLLSSCSSSQAVSHSD